MHRKIKTNISREKKCDFSEQNMQNNLQKYYINKHTDFNTNNDI